MFGERPVVIDGNDWARSTVHGLESVVATHRSERQRIEILDLTRFGLSLWIDGWPQFSMLDEHRYHQLLVLPALFYHPHPADVLILGGGDYLAAWRALMRRGVRRVKIADWDRMVAVLVLSGIPAVNELGVHLDPRVDFSTEIDVTEYLPATEERFDAIIGDLTDLTTLGELLPDFAEHIFRILKPGGVFVTQAGELSLAAKPLEHLTKSVEPFKGRFQSVWLSGYHIESFAYTQAFLTAWKDRVVEPHLPRQKDLAKKFDSRMVRKDRPFYGPAIHRAAFTLDPMTKAALGI